MHSQRGHLTIRGSGRDQATPAVSSRVPANAAAQRVARSQHAPVAISNLYVFLGYGPRFSWRASLTIDRNDMTASETTWVPRASSSG